MAAKYPIIPASLEAYLRYRSISYENLTTIGNEEKLIAGVGAVQMPVVEMDDGRWMTDSTPMLAWLDDQQNGSSIYPTDPALRFAALMIEDYADEWLWRPAMHYRWSYRNSRDYAAQAIFEDVVEPQKPYPRWLAIRMIKKRQLGGFVTGDGINDRSRTHADQTYLTSLDLMEAIFTKRPFLLGEVPTIADFGMMGPMFRHFGMDPYPAEIMRDRAPGVYEWVARVWNSKAGDTPKLIDNIDDELAALLIECCETNLAQHVQNAKAFGQDVSRYDLMVQETIYEQVPASRYRVWCLEELRREWDTLEESTQEKFTSTLTCTEAAILWNGIEFAPSDYDIERKAPFNQAINVFGDGVPPK